MSSQLSEMFEKDLVQAKHSPGFLPVAWYEEETRQAFAEQDDSVALGRLTMLTAELIGKVEKLERDAEEQNQ